jgi:hypothetical protein
VLSAAIEPGAGRWRIGRQIPVRLVRATWVRSLALTALIGAIGVLCSWLLVGVWMGASTATVLAAALLWLPLTITLVLALDAAAFAKRTMRAIAANGFGLCDGHTQANTEHLPLTDWMTDRLDQMAGRSTAGRPLTLGDLWGADAVTAFEDAVGDDAAFLDLLPHQRREIARLRLIDLETMTTNLTLRRPYRFPFESRIFSFCPSCFAAYFPERVVAQLVEHGPEVADRDSPPISMMCPRHPAIRVRRFPQPQHVPVVVAARISLSFPGLISALPFCYVDFARAPGHVALVQAWFSDGGIASNFPMHLFDDTWPARPTFGINLQPRTAEHGPDDAVVPRSPNPRSHAIGSLSEFVHSILDTMQNWTDVTQLTLPAYRGRVAELRLAADEGGMNLRMPADLIERIARRGATAAALFDDFDLPAHQRRRFEASMAAIDDLLDGLVIARDRGFDAVIDASAPKRRRDSAAALLALGDSWHSDHPATAADLPRPIADLRSVPRQ